MDINRFFENVVDELHLGNKITSLDRVSGGLTHKMYKVFTDKGRYVVKLLNPNIMKRETAIANFNRADELEEVLRQNHISAVYSIAFHGKKLQKIGDQYFYVYEWYDGKTLKDSEIKEENCQLIGEGLAQIHNIDLIYGQEELEEKNIDWNFYINLAKEKKSPIYEILLEKIDILNDSMYKGNEAIHKLPKVKAICHNDMDPKNVMWIDSEFKLIDLECLTYKNPYLELYELALCWSGCDRCKIDFSRFNVFFESYFANSRLDRNVNWEDLYYANNGRLEWLEFNIKRSLMIECDTKEEQELGISEVKETMKYIVYYDKIKNDILHHIDALIGDDKQQK